MKIAVLCGHGWNTKGKESPDGSYKEWKGVREIAGHMQHLLECCYSLKDHQIDFVNMGPIEIPLGAKAQFLNDMGYDFAIELHSNAAGRKGWNEARGARFIYWHRSKASKRLAGILADNFMTGDGPEPKTMPTRKLYMCRKPDCPSVICELFFHTNIDDIVLFRKHYKDMACDLLAGLLEIAEGATK